MLDDESLKGKRREASGGLNLKGLLRLTFDFLQRVIFRLWLATQLKQRDRHGLWVVDARGRLHGDNAARAVGQEWYRVTLIPRRYVRSPVGF